MLPADVAARYEREGRWSGETLVERATREVERDPDALAIVDGQRRLTRADLDASSAALAGHLTDLGARSGKVVSWQLPNWWEAAVVHHAILRTGATPNPLHQSFGARDLQAIVARVDPVAFIGVASWHGEDRTEAARAAGAPAVIAVRGGDREALALEDLLLPGADPPRDSTPEPADDALLLFTSGTTSAPKGVRLSHRALLCELDSFPDIHGLTPDDRLLGGAPVTHIAGLAYGVLAPLALGTSTVLLERWDPSRALEAVATNGATFMTGPPTFLLTLAEHARAPDDVRSFRLFSTGGASIPTDEIRRAGERLGCIVKRAYGSTEVPTLTATRLDDPVDLRIGTDGRVVGGAEMRIVLASGEDAPPGAEGQIWARAPEMLDGYLGDAEAEAFAPEGWFRTGDLGSVDARGYLRVTGRMKDIVIRGGENISAKEVEDVLLGHPAVIDVAVVGMPDRLLGERVCAFMVAREPLTLHDLTSFAAARGLAKHKLPEHLELVDSLPRTESGKVRKHELRARLR